MKYHFKIHKQDGGLWAECLELEGLVTQGENRATLQENMEEALALFLNEPKDSKHIFPMPNPYLKGRGIVEVQVNPLIAMAMHVRQSRIAAGWTQAETARRLGITSLYSYQRMENPKHANLQLDTIAKLKKVFPDLSVDEVLA